MSSDATSRPLSVAATSAASSLAPGFRFHPTDEELVIYYLKRKVFGKPFRVDAISELDLYKSEPWDLPEQSKIRSRDMEWYFFSPLDRKYANRSRTSRTTGKGYWKTTGKDRAVRRGSRVVGMKKTLVFHIGKAPKGERTNWVMHEYRLEEDELARSGKSQDDYVVCRIFQKTGAGPQNGAQYGAPLLEEEWEEEEDGLLLPKAEDREVATLEFGDNLFMQLDDINQECKAVDVPLVTSSNGQHPCNDVLDNEGQNVIDQTMDSTSLLAQEHGNQDFSNFIDNNEVGRDEFDDYQDEVGFSDNDLPEIDQNIKVLGDDYLELDDFLSIQDFVVCNDINENGQDSTSILAEEHDVDEFVNATEENAVFSVSAQKQMYSASNNNSCIELNDQFHPVFDKHSSYNEADDSMIYFDAPTRSLVTDHDTSSIEMNEFLLEALTEPSEPDMLDEIFSYFDATDNNLFYSCLDDSTSFESQDLNKFQVSPEDNKEGGQTTEALQLSSNTNNLEVVGDHSCPKKDSAAIVPDVHSENGWDKGFKKHLIGMLGSISSPPALAAEYPVKGTESPRTSAAYSSNSIRVTAGMIHVDGLMLSGNGNHWPIQKGEDAALLSHGIPREDGIMDVFKPVEKIHGGILSWLIRSGFCLSFLSVLYLAVSFKIGSFICNK